MKLFHDISTKYCEVSGDCLAGALGGSLHLELTIVENTYKRLAKRSNVEIFNFKQFIIMSFNDFSLTSTYVELSLSILKPLMLYHN